MRNALRFFVMVFLCLQSGVIYANEVCSNRTPSAAVDICVAEHYKKADLALNKIYMGTLNKIAADYKADAKLHTELRSKFKSAQFAWIKFRDANCAVTAFEADEDKPAYLTTLRRCMTRMTIDRTAEISKNFPN